MYSEVDLAFERMILSGELHENSAFSIDGMISKLGRSKSMVREALASLSDYGIVVPRHRVGSYIHRYTDEQQEEAFFTRQKLETLAIGKLAGTAQIIQTQKEKDLLFSPLFRIVDRMQSFSNKADEIMAADFCSDFFLTDLEFHYTLAVVARCPSIARMVRRLYLITFLCSQSRISTKYQSDMPKLIIHEADRVTREHKDIVCAMYSGNSDLAIQKYLFHIENAEESWEHTAKQLSNFILAGNQSAGLPVRHPYVVAP